MKVTIQSVEDLGLVVRAARKSSGVRQDDLAGFAGLSKQFAADVERGKPTVQFGRVLQLLREAGVTLLAEIPESVGNELDRQRLKRRSAEVPDA